MLIGQWTKVLISAIIVTALDPGHSQRVVTAFREPVHTVGDTIQVESAVISSIVLFVRQGECVYMVSQNGLQDIPATLLVLTLILPFCG